MEELVDMYGQPFSFTLELCLFAQSHYGDVLLDVGSKRKFLYNRVEGMLVMIQGK